MKILSMQNLGGGGKEKLKELENNVKININKSIKQKNLGKR